MPGTTNLTESLKKLEAIAEWFDEQQDIDVEEGLTKVKEAAGLIKSSKARLAAIENEFQAIEREVGSDDDIEVEPAGVVTRRPEDTVVTNDQNINLDDIPF